MKLAFPRRFQAWLVATVSLTAVAGILVAPMTRPHAQSPPTTYTIIDLGLASGTESKAFAVNSCGQVAGYATFGGSAKRPFFRPSNSLIDLGVLSGDGTATGLNNSGYVIGNSPTGTPTDRAFIWHDDNGDGDSDAGEMKDLLVGFQGSASAEDINDNGRVVGWVLADSGSSLGHQSFVWENNSFQIISGSPGHLSPIFNGINNAGSIVGEDSNLLRGFILRNGIFTDIAPFGTGNKSVAYAVSEADHVVGSAKLNSGGLAPLHAFIWTDAGPNPGLKDLGTLPGLTNSEAYNVAIVNSSVQVVGASYNEAVAPGASARAFVWQDANGDGDGDDPDDAGEMKDLTLISPDSSWTVLQQARSINSSGQIVGFGMKTNGETHAFLLTPANFTPSQCLPTVNVSVSPSAVNEVAATSMTYTFTRSIVTANPLTVNFSTTGTAAAGNDYSISSTSTVQIPANMASVAITVTPMADTTDEPNETVILTVTSGAGYTVGPQNSATGTITDDDATPTIQITSNVTAAETNSGSTPFAFTVSLTNPSSSPITVNYATATGTTNPATGGTTCGTGVDFVNALNTLTFAAGETSKPVTVDVCGDNDVEPDETFFVNLSGNSANSNLPLNSKGTGTITNDDSFPTVSVAVAPPTTPEGGANLVYTFTRSSTVGSLTVNFSVGGAADASDYTQTGATTFTPLTGTVTFAAGSPTATVTVDPTADSTVEPDETLILTLTTGASYTIGSPSAATGTITNDDTDASVTVSPSSVIESDAPNLVYTFSRVGVTTGALTVNFSVGGTATLNTDYTQSGAATFSASAGTVTLPDGSSSATVTLDPTPDFIHEGDETATLTVTTGPGYNVVSPSSQQGTITDDDATPTIQITSVTAPEPISGSTSFVFTASLTNASSSPITVNYATATGTTNPATGGTTCGTGVDFVNALNTLTFAAGETSKPVTVDVCGDNDVEPDETFSVNLSGNSPNSNLAAGTKGTGTITPQPPVVFTEEGNGTFAVAVDSVTFARGPFRLTNDLNFSSDRRTRVILVTSPLGMTNANLPSGILTVNVAGYANPLPIEHVGPITGVTGLNASFIIVRLPAELSTLNPAPGPNNLTLTVKMGSATSNATLLSISP